MSEEKRQLSRVFGDAKEKHGMRFTQLRGLLKVKMQVALTFACMNLKKLANWKHGGPHFSMYSFAFFFFSSPFQKKELMPSFEPLFVYSLRLPTNG